MKRKLAAVLSLLILLTGCGTESSEQVFTADGVSITLPSSFSVAETTADYVAGYTSDDVIVLISRTDKQTLADLGYGTELSLDEYGGLVVSQFDVGSYQAYRRQDYIFFTYTAYVLDDYFFYTTAVYQTTEAFWTISFTCLNAVKDDYAKEMIAWSATVSFQ